MRFSIVNLGCKVNQVELEKVSDDLIAVGYQMADDSADADFAIINTCTVTKKADAKSLKTIKKLEASEHLQSLFVTGCFTELEKGLREKLREKTVIVSQKEKGNLVKIIENHLRKSFGYDEHLADYQDKWHAFKQSRVFAGHLKNQQSQFHQHTRAFVKVQDGCNAFCSYCRIPFARGGPVSRAIDDLLEQISLLNKAGVPEIVLTGINMSIYRHKKEDKSVVDFSQMLRLVLECCDKSFVRISSLEPHYLDDRFLQCLTHPQFTPHLHLPLQATSNRILSQMNRLYTLEQYAELIHKIYAINPLFSLSTDVITGYPDESEEEFRQGVDFLRECKFSSLHVFPFSFRPLTKDAENKDSFTNPISAATRTQRARDLREVGAQLQKKYAQSLLKKKMRFVVEGFSSSATAGAGTSATLASSSTRDNNQELLRKMSEGGAGAQVRGISEYYLKGKVFVDDPELLQKMEKGKNLEVVLAEIAEEKNIFLPV